jgi:sec-independent protein translocase protein TatA
MPGNIGLTEVIIVLIVALLVFGPKKLPEMGRGLGKGMREFKTSLTGDDRDDDDATPRRAQAQELPPAVVPPPAPTGSGPTAAPPVTTGTGPTAGNGTPR